MLTQPTQGVGPPGLIGSARVAVLLLVASAVTACVPRPVETPGGAPPAPTVAPAPAAIPRDARRYEVDPGASRLTVLVRRAGPLAQLGHNHAITTQDVTGLAWVGRTPEGSGFELRVPVASFVVDDPAARAAAGPEFPGTVPDDARAGTRQNMLRTEVLDAAHHPDVLVRCDRVTGSWQQPVAHVAITLRGTARAYDVPVVLQLDGRRLLARGSLTFKQTDFGITPFSVAGGAIQVADVVEVRFEIAASETAQAAAR